MLYHLSRSIGILCATRVPTVRDFVCAIGTGNLGGASSSLITARHVNSLSQVDSVFQRPSPSDIGFYVSD
jgi:hypothetical protein